MDLEKYLKLTCFPQRYMSYDIKDYIGAKSKDKVDTLLKILETPKELLDEGYKLFVSGINNTQKTSVVCYFLREIIKRYGIRGYYVTMKGLYDTLVEKEFDKEGYKPFAEESALLVVDEAFDPRKLYISGKTTFQESLLDDFFRAREMNKKPTIFISNVRKDDVDVSFGESLRHMLNRDCVELLFEDIIPPAVMNKKILEYLGSLRVKQ